VIKKKYVSYSYVKDKEKLVIVLKKYCTEVNRLFVFQCFSNVFKKGFCKVKKGSLGLVKKSKVSKKKELLIKTLIKRPINSKLKSC
jgi:hypothetical protein